jgi:hypothetical protein
MSPLDIPVGKFGQGFKGALKDKLLKVKSLLINSSRSLISRKMSKLQSFQP